MRFAALTRTLEWIKLSSDPLNESVRTHTGLYIDAIGRINSLSELHF